MTPAAGSLATSGAELDAEPTPTSGAELDAQPMHVQSTPTSAAELDVQSEWLPAADLVARLRGRGRERPLADRAGCAGLREWIEDELAGWPGDRDVPVRIGWWSLALGDATTSPWAVDPEPPKRTEPAEASGRRGRWGGAAAAAGAAGTEPAEASGRRGRRGGVAAAAGTEGAAAASDPEPTGSPRLLDGLVRVLFRQWVTCRRIDVPLADALAGLRASGDPAGLAKEFDCLPVGERRVVAAELALHTRRLVATWPPIDPRWAPRAGERWSVPVAGGRAVMVGRPDLVLGHPARQRAAVGLVGVTAGSMGTAPWRRLWFAALVETLRSGVQPFQISMFRTSSGTLSERRVELKDLRAVAADAVAAIRAAAPVAPAALAGVSAEGFETAAEPAVTQVGAHLFRPGPAGVTDAGRAAGSARAAASGRGLRPGLAFRCRSEHPAACDGVRMPQVAS